MNTVTQLPWHSGRPIPLREDRDWLTSHELTAQAGISFRQLDYWCRTNLLTPLDHANPGSGHLRRFHHTQAHRAHLIRTLLDAGLSLQVIRSSIDEFQTTGTFTTGHLTITIHDPGDAA